MGKKPAALLIWLLLSVPIAISVYRAGAEGSRTFQWDPASHALNGLRLSDGITRADPVDFFRALILPHHYPPVHSILQTPFYIALGRTRDAARMTTVAALLVLVVLAVALARKCGADAIFGPLLILAAIASSPHFLACAAVPMLELFGGLAFLLFALAYARSLEAPDSPRRAVAAGLAALAVYLTAINFAIILFAAIAVYEAVRGDLRGTVRAVRGFFAGYKPLNVFVAAAALALLVSVWVKFTGGIVTSRFRVTGLMGPIAAAIGILALHLAIELWRRRDAVRRWPARLKGFFWATLVPIAGWLIIYPSRLRVTLNFLQGAPQKMPFGEKMAFYPLAWIGDYHLSSAIGIACVLALVGVFARWKRQPEPARFVAVLAGVGLLALFAHGMRDLRFFIPILPLLWILLASEIGRLSEGRVTLRAAVALALAATAWPAWELHRFDLSRRIAETWYSDTGMAQPLRVIADETAAAKSSARVFGTFGGLSWHLVEFEVRVRRPWRGFACEIDQNDPAKDNQTARQAFDRWLRMSPEERVVTIEQGPEWKPDSPAAAAVHDVAALLADCDRYRLTREYHFRVRGLRIRVWDRQ